MEPELIPAIVGAILSILAASLGFAATKEASDLLRRLGILPKKESISFAERLSALMEKLNAASSEVDVVLREISRVAQHRQETVEKLEKNLHHLESKEKQAKERIEVLENTPVEAAEYFAELISAVEKRSKKRDFVLFGAGAVVSAVVGLAIRFVD